MANIYDYLINNGHLNFKEHSFNEVDNLILAQTSYINFDGIEGIENELLPVEEVRKRYFQLRYKTAKKNKSALLEQSSPFLLDYLANVYRYEDLRLGYYKNIVDLDETGQFSAIVCDLPHMVYISYRGTDDTVVGWKEDFYFSFAESTMSQKFSVSYANEVFEKISPNKEIHLGGHSKGGNLAIYAGVFCKDYMKERIKTIWDNDGPGFSEDFLEQKSYEEIRDKIVRIIPETSIIGLLMNHDVTPIIIQSSESHILQHYGESWQVQDKVFLRAPILSKEAVFLDTSITSWLDKIPINQRKKFIDAVFYCIENAGYDTLQSLSDDGFGALFKIKDAAETLEKDDKKIILEFLNMFFVNSKNILKDSIRDRIKTTNLPSVPSLKDLDKGKDLLKK